MTTARHLRLLEAAADAARFDWDAWNADMDARFAACQRAEDEWRRQAEATHEAALAVIEAFDRAVASLTQGVE